MAVPFVTAISPTVGPTAGRTLVQIMGGNFQLPPAPPASGRVPVPNPSVEVLFGGVPATKVAVANDARLFALTPASPLPPGSPSGSVDIIVRNVDQDGNVVPGETVTVSDAFAYQLPNLNAQPEYDLTRLVRTVLQEFKRQLLPKGVYHTVHTDYSDDPASQTTALAGLPAIIISGPMLVENRFFSVNAPREQANSFGLGAKYFGRLRQPYTVDLGFGIVGVTDNTIQNMNLMSETVAFFNRNKTLAMLAEANNVKAGYVQYEMDFAPNGQPKVATLPNDSNIRAFRGSFVVRGFDIDDANMDVAVTRLLEDYTAEGSVGTPSPVIVNVEQTGVAYPIGRSPGSC